jgi:hypothetical protein
VTLLFVIHTIFSLSVLDPNSGVCPDVALIEHGACIRELRIVWIWLLSSAFTRQEAIGMAGNGIVARATRSVWHTEPSSCSTCSFIPVPISCTAQICSAQAQWI